MLHRHADGETVPDDVVVRLGSLIDADVDIPLDEYITSVGGEKLGEYTYRIPTAELLSVIQRPDVFYAAQPEDATEVVDPYPTLDQTLNDVVAAYAGGVPAENAAQYAKFIKDDLVLVVMNATDAATIASIRQWLEIRNVYVPPLAPETVLAADRLVVMVPVAELAPLTTAFPSTYLQASTLRGAGVPLTRSRWPQEGLEFANDVVAQYLPQGGP